MRLPIPFLVLPARLRSYTNGNNADNTARGELIVDDHLIAALKSGRVAAARLDVFEGEPKLNPDYAGLKNTFLLPHIGSATVESRTLMGMVALDNIDAVLTGKQAPSLVAAQTGDFSCPFIN